MRIGITVGFLVLAVFVAWNGHASQPAADAERVEKLIRQLGSTLFPVRSQAAAELEKLGPAALEPLRKAAASDDRELSARAGELLQKVETKIFTERMLAPKRLRLAVKDASVADAVARLAKLSGYPVEISGDSKKLLDRKITLDTGETTFWDALEQLCAKADLQHLVPVQPEQPKAMGGGPVVINIGNLPKVGGPPVKPNPVEPAPASPQPEVRSKVLLADGRTPERPTQLAGSIRIRAVPDTGKMQPGEIRLVLEASAEPRLREFGIIATPLIDKAIDDQDQKLVAAPMPMPQNPNPGGGNGINIAMKNGQVFINGQPAGGSAAPKHRTMPVQLRLGEKPAKSLKELSGTVLVQALKDESEMLVSVNNIIKAAGTKVKGKDEHELEIVAVEKLADGDLKIQLVLHRPGEANPRANNGVNNIAVINGRVLINGQPVGAGGVGPARLEPREYPKLTDAKGATHAPVAGRELDGKKTYELIYRLPGEPAQLVFSGQRAFTFAVPFTLKNVPLP